MATTFENHPLDLSTIKQRKSKALGRTTSLPAFMVKPFERAHSTDGIHNQVQSPMARPQPAPSCGKPSRYREDFIEQGKLGSGGFGTVCKAQNKLDGSVYAMKKIPFKSKNSSALEKVLREVKALAKLDHPNVVRYYQSWIEEECVDPLSHFKTHQLSRGKYASDDGTCSARTIKTTYDEDDDSCDTEERKPSKAEEDEAEFNSPPGEQIWNFHMRDMFSKIGPSKASEDDLSVEFERDQSSEESEEDESSDSSSYQDETTFDMDLHEPHDASQMGSDWLILRKKIQKSFRTKKNINLYIQMQLCEDTLQGWIESRTCVDRIACISIFRQLCKGLEYIHGEGIIHRDLKPSNIFLLSKDQIRESDRKEIESPRSISEAKWVVIGDFGLAVYRQGQDTAGTVSLSSSVELSQSSSTEHTSGVGTTVYASPEQIHEQSYDEKTDIYSLGIIFFELLCFMSTKMERAHLLANLRKNILPPDFLKNHPKESAFILWLMAPSPEDRPTTAQILKHEIFRSDSLSISRTSYDRMQDRLKQQEQIIEQQRRQIEELQQMLLLAKKQ